MSIPSFMLKTFLPTATTTWYKNVKKQYEKYYK